MESGIGDFRALCGIAGYTHSGRTVSPARIRTATASLTHRGPDQQDVWQSGDVSLGAVRLKIIDLDGGDQPIVSEDGGTVIVFNGEVYNFRELRDELAAKGHRFHSHCDTEVVLHAFLEWDTACFEKLRGMFAVALWQQRTKRLILARDRLGVKPLYVAQHSGELYFASELKAIFEHPEIPRRLNTTALSYYLSLNYVPTPLTLVEGIEKLPAGNFLEWHAGTARIEPYWNLRLFPSQRHTLDSAKEELDGLMRDSIRDHLISDVPLGVFASGGIDSTTILHYAAEQFSGRLKTFSVSFEGKKFDESTYFREVARTYSTDHHEFDLADGLPLADAIEHLVHYNDEPSADAGAVPMWFLSQMTRRHVTVALSGEGADEIFGGYETYFADDYAARAQAIPAGLRRAALHALRLWPVSNDKISLEYKLKRFLAGTLLPPEQAHLYWNGTFTDEEKARFYSGSRASTSDLMRRLPPEAVASGRLNRYLWLDQKFYLADDILTKCDRMSMAHSLEVRPPFLDHRIVEFAASLPEDLKIRGGTLKFILRELVRDKVPARVLTRPKQGFDIPAHLWFRTTLKPLLMDTLNENAVRNTGVFDWPGVARVIEDHLSRRANLGYHLWGLLTLFLWMRHWKIDGPAPRETKEALDAPIFAAN